MMGPMLRRMQSFDTFSKAKTSHVQRKTGLGACITVLGVIIMTSLFLSELAWYRKVQVVDHARVDTRQGQRDLHITLDIKFLALKCDDIDIGALDNKGVPYDVSRRHLFKEDLTEEEEKETQKQPQCHIGGSLELKKVAGAFFFTMAHHLTSREVGGHHTHLLSYEQVANFNVSHEIEHLSFGPTFPGQSRPLENTRQIATKPAAEFQYFVQLVPTVYKSIDGDVVDSEQFSVTEFVNYKDPTSPFNSQPSVIFKYDVSPILVETKETRKSFFQFLTSVCAIVGGLYAVSGLINQGIHGYLEKSRKHK
eukprot:gb/GECG01011407.1/.p1 GENE.gb/GECG01011407.1/~~gb/GECG01011407.1/.p1  ORF type:complete len:308 (+),score=29.16 gb/GECG01011407.1/:1-924(+)